MWANDKSYLDIAKEYGITRNMVSGIVSRNKDLFPTKEGIKKRGSLMPSRLLSSPEKQKKKKAKTVSDIGRVHPQFHGTKQATYADPELDEFERSRLPGLRLVDNDGCMYPISLAHGEHRFCAHTRSLGKRYCQHHVHKTTGYMGLDIGYRASYDKNVIRERV